MTPHFGTVEKPDLGDFPDFYLTASDTRWTNWHTMSLELELELEHELGCTWIEAGIGAACRQDAGRKTYT